MSRRLAPLYLLSLVGVAALHGPAALAQAQPAAAPRFPAATWERIADPASVGYCEAGLAAARDRVKGMTTTALTVVVGGRVLFEHGPQEQLSYLASVRKSILAMLFGNYVSSGKIRLDATLEELKIDDVQGLLPAEKKATVADLLAARSGVYHEAANAACTGCGSTAGDPPGPRGSVKPGTYFLYNNWDFNALGTIFEQQTGLDIYEAFEKDIAIPTGMQDFNRAGQRKTRNDKRSQHPAYHFDLSTRDMARVGYLMLRGGQWGGKTVVPRDWVKRIITTVTPVGEMHPDDMKKGPFGYSYLWWVWDGPFNQGIFKGGYTGIGAIGQFITVLPALDMVVAHKTEPRSPAVSRPQYIALLEAIGAAKCR